MGGGGRFCQALALLSGEDFVESTLAVYQGVLDGREAWITAKRQKFNPQGEPLEDYTEAGDYLTTGYRFSIAEDSWEFDRVEPFEGAQGSLDYGGALAANADRDYCETMVQIKCALDRFGGEALLKPVIQGEQVVGVAAYYQHLARGAQSEPDSETDTQPHTPEQEHEAIEAEVAAA